MTKMNMFSTGIVLGGLLIASAPAVAQQQQGNPRCGPRDQVIAMLSQQYGEYPVAYGVHRPDILTELLVNSETGTWTVLHSRIDGMSCLVDDGQSWTPVAAPLPGEGA